MYNYYTVHVQVSNIARFVEPHPTPEGYGDAPSHVFTIQKSFKLYFRSINQNRSFFANWITENSSIKIGNWNFIEILKLEFYWTEFRAVAVDRKKGDKDGHTSDDDYEQFGGKKNVYFFRKILMDEKYFENFGETDLSCQIQIKQIWLHLGSQ